ncbi:MAG: hypothetical protein S4CHLAM45_02990 [Chlamydiales bacterium]|nr:hypothetical protein [Chlamydiales bacterium]MCH9619157.1 hypothetical protein [Chlamydiales bacterium]MCH9622419.1 hypothetical protein [Chlamydiales bacterium]
MLNSLSFFTSETCDERAFEPLAIGEISLSETTLKILFYCTALIPLIALAIKTNLRSAHNLQLADETQAATKIQAAWRGHFVRAQCTKREAAAVKIQTAWRGHFVRAQFKKEKINSALLSYAYLRLATPYLAPDELEQLPKVLDGRTNVYLLPNLPVVLKGSGRQASKERFEQMGKAQIHCRSLGYQHLVIPKARVHQHFIVEERLSIVSTHRKYQIGLYTKNSSLFTAAVKEFTDFLCHATLTDIVESGFYYYEGKLEAHLGRYDNIALYLEGEEGKIGLVDLERYENSLQNPCYEEICKTALLLFPHHLEEIMAVIGKYDQSIESHRSELEQLRDKALKGFKSLYGSHLEFANRHGITPDEPLKLIQIDPAQIKERVGSTDSDEVFSTAIEAIYAFLKGKLEKKGLPSSMEELLAHRTLSILLQDPDDLKDLDLSMIHECDRNSVIKSIFHALAEEGAIAEFRQIRSDQFCLFV